MTKDSLGDRMKDYESAPKSRLVRRVPVMIRLDGKAFHTYTRGLPRPYHRPFHELMWDAALYLCENIQGCKLAYVQSDEITLLLTDYENIKTEGWFDYQVQKMCSVAASMATMAFNMAVMKQTGSYAKASACFDARVWNLPQDEVCNAFIWRQQDATRNAIQMVGQSLFSHKELQGVSCDEIQEMAFRNHGINFNDLPVPQKRGVCIVRKEEERAYVNHAGLNRLLTGQLEGMNLDDMEFVTRNVWSVDEAIPIFTQDRDYIDQYVYPKPEPKVISSPWELIEGEEDPVNTET